MRLWMVGAVHDPHEDTNAACAAEAFHAITGILDACVSLLEKKPLLRIHFLRVTRGEAKEGRIELIYAVDERAPS